MPRGAPAAATLPGRGGIYRSNQGEQRPRNSGKKSRSEKTSWPCSSLPKSISFQARFSPKYERIHGVSMTAISRDITAAPCQVLRKPSIAPHGNAQFPLDVGGVGGAR